MTFILLAQRAKIFIAILLIAVLVLPWAAPSVRAKETASAKAVQFTDVSNGYPFVLDDHGNLWATSVSSRAYRKNLLPFRANMVKMENMSNVVSISNRFVLKEDGTVWTVEYGDSQDHDKDKWGQHAPGYIARVPGLENIAKIAIVAESVLAVDREGRLWIAESLPRWAKESRSPNSPPLVERKASLVHGIDRVKDVSATLILKEDGTVWTWTCQQTTCDRTNPVQVKGLAEIEKVSGTFALKKDGTVWVWKGPAIESGDHTVALQVEALTDIVDISASFYPTRMLALKKDGTVWSRGLFPKTQEDLIGIHTLDKEKTVYQIEGITDAAAVFSLHLSIAVIKKDGSLWMWGYDSIGLFGEPQSVQPNPTHVELKLVTE